MKKHKGKETLDQSFEIAAGIAQQPPTALEFNIGGSLKSLYVSLTPSRERPDADFNPTLKLGNKTVPFHDAVRDLSLMRNITAISIERNGTSHDFPIRFEKPSGLARLHSLFNRAEEAPAIVITGLDGNERRFQTYMTGSGSNRHELESTKPIAQFLAEELGQKHRAGMTRPAVSGPAI